MREKDRERESESKRGRKRILRGSPLTRYRFTFVPCAGVSSRETLVPSVARDRRDGSKRRRKIESLCEPTWRMNRKGGGSVFTFDEERMDHTAVHIHCSIALRLGVATGNHSANKTVS